MARRPPRTSTPPGEVSSSPPEVTDPDGTEGGLPLWAEIFLVTLFCGGLLAHLQLMTPHVLDNDAFYHMKVAKLMWESGRPLEEFPWNQFSVFKEHYSDSSFLYHVFLIPFTFLPGDVEPIKLAAIVMSTLFFMSFYLFLRLNRCRFPVIWMVLLIGSGALFLYRLLMARGFILSMVLALWGLHALVRRRSALLFVVSFLYPLSYTAFQIVLFLVGFHSLVRYPREGLPAFKPLGIAAAGCCLGLLAHPNFPDDLYLWWVQNVRVLFLKWVSREAVPFGGELYPPELHTILHSTTTLVVLLFVGYLAALLWRGERSESTLFLFLSASFFGVLALLSRRFVEYWAPLTVAFAAFFTTDLMREVNLVDQLRKAPGRFWSAGTLALLVAGGLMFRSYLEIRHELGQTHNWDVKEFAEWLGANTKREEMVFTGDWDDFPKLFYYNHHNRYLVCLDPTFLFDFDRKTWDLWNEVREARTPELYHPIRRYFGARFAFVTNDFQPFIQQMEKDPRFRLVMKNRDAHLFELQEDLDFVTGWSVSGPYGTQEKDYASLDSLMLGNLGLATSPPDAGARFHPWQPYPVDRLGRFVNLGKMLEGREHCTAYAVTEIESPVEQSVDLLAGFDDAFTLWLNGEKILAESGPSQARIDDRRFEGKLIAGTNRLLVRCDNVERNWGFYLRVAGVIQPIEKLQPDLTSR